MKRTAFDEKSDQRAVEAPPKDYHCPANGCPNAASVSFDHGARWACFEHAKAAPYEWPQIAQATRDNWPASGNWSHPEKLEHEAERAAARRAAMKPRTKARFGLSVVDALAIGESA